MTFNKLYHICNKYQFFTNGDNSQYTKLFELNDKPTTTLHDLALIIYICSTNVTYEYVLEILMKEQQLWQNKNYNN